MDDSSGLNQAYQKSADYCAAQEHCISEVRGKLHAWGIQGELWPAVIAKLVAEGFINEHRYAVSFARGKFRMNEWGKIKIASELRFKSIPADLIKQALDSIDQEEYQECLRRLLSAKMRHLGAKSNANRQKAARYLTSKGFEPSLIFGLLKDKNNYE